MSKPTILDVLDDSFEELETIIEELDLSSSTIKKLLGILEKDKKIALNELLNCKENEDEC